LALRLNADYGLLWTSGNIVLLSQIRISNEVTEFMFQSAPFK